MHSAGRSMMAGMRLKLSVQAWPRTLVQRVAKLVDTLQNDNARHEARNLFFMPSLCHLYACEDCPGGSTVNGQVRNRKAAPALGVRYHARARGRRFSRNPAPPRVPAA